VNSLSLALIVQWFTDLFINKVFGDPVMAGVFGWFLLIMIGWKMNLGPDSMIVLGLFSGVLFTEYSFTNFPLGIMFTIAISISLVTVGILKVLRHG